MGPRPDDENVSYIHFRAVASVRKAVFATGLPVRPIGMQGMGSTAAKNIRDRRFPEERPVAFDHRSQRAVGASVA